MFRMNDDNSDDKSEDELQSFFISDKNGNTYTNNPKSLTRNSSTRYVNWKSANPDDMVIDYEASSAMDFGQNSPSDPQCVEAHDHQSSSDFISKEVLAMHKDPPCQPSAHVINSEESKCVYNFNSLESFQDRSIEPSLPFKWGSSDDLNCTGYPTALQLNRTFDLKADKVNGTFISHPPSQENPSWHTTGSPQPIFTGSGNASLSCSPCLLSRSDKKHVGEMSCFRDRFGSPQVAVQGTAYTAFANVVMQTDVFVPDNENQCPYSSGKVTSEYADGSQQRLVGEKEITSPTSVSDGMDDPSGSALQEFFCLSEDEPNNELHSPSSYGQKEVGPNLREAASDCFIDGECLLPVPAFDSVEAQVLNPEHTVTVAEETQVISVKEDSGIQNHTKELILSSPPEQKVMSSVEQSWDTNNVVVNTINKVFTSTPVLKSTNTTFSISPIKATEKCSKAERNNRELQNLPNLKGTPMNISKSTLGKSTTKANISVGSKVRKTEIISYPRPNFKNVKAKVISRSVLPSKDPLSKVAPRPPLTSVTSPSSVSSRQLTALSKTPRSNLNADTKVEILINKTHKQQFNKLITSQAVQIGRAHV